MELKDKLPASRKETPYQCDYTATDKNQKHRKLSSLTAILSYEQNANQSVLICKFVGDCMYSSP